MALKDLFALTDPKLEAEFQKRAYDPARDRDAFVKKVDSTLEKFLATEPPRGRKDFNVANNIVAYTPTLNGKPIRFNDAATHYIPAERFQDFATKLKAEIQAGSLDDVLKRAAEEEAGATEVKPRRERKAAGEGGGGRGWSEERRAKFAASIAARNAKKQAG